MTKSAELAEYFASLEFDCLPQEVVAAAKGCILDTLGCIFAGTAVEVMPGLVKELVEDGSQFEATLPGFGQKTSVLTAGILNGTMGHAVEMDDVHKQAKSHAGTVVIPAALASGEQKAVSGKAFILAVVVGYEVMLRIGIGINASSHRLQGWHATGTCGTFGAAAAAAKLSNFTKEQFISALGLAGTQSSGLWAFTADGANNKMFHAGSAVMAGLLSVKLAKAGLTGPSEILEARDGGLYRASSKGYELDRVTDHLGECFHITQVSKKPFASCRSMHPPIQAALAAKRKGIMIETIKRIKVKTYEVARVQCGFTNTPKNPSEAKFSIPYGVAIALLDGNALIDQFTQKRINNDDWLDLAKRVEVHADDGFTSKYPNQWGCSVEIETTTGETYLETVSDARGDPVKPFSKKEIEEKFRYLAKKSLSRQQADQVIYNVDQLEYLETINQLFDGLTRKVTTKEVL